MVAAFIGIALALLMQTRPATPTVGPSTRPSAVYAATTEADAYVKQCMLADGENVKLVEPPYTDERNAAARTVDEHSDVNAMTLATEIAERPSVRLIGASYPPGYPLYSLLNYVLAVPVHEIAIPRDIADARIVGDWIIRKSASEDERMKALGEILTKKLNHPVVFVRDSSPIDVVVFRGMITPRDEVKDGMITLELPIEAAHIVRPLPLGGGSLQDVIAAIETATGWPIIDETKPGKTPLEFDWGSGSRQVFANPGVQQTDRDELAAWLDVIRDQLGIEIKIESRELKRWKLSEQR